MCACGFLVPNLTTSAQECTTVNKSNKQLIKINSFKQKIN